MTDAKPAAKEEHKARLRPLQIMASTLAAVTGAFLASRLGVYGTVIGVGVMSALSTVIGEFYLRSLERTKAVANYSSLAAKVRATRLNKLEDGRLTPVETEGAEPDEPAEPDRTAADDAVTTRAAASGFLSRIREFGRLRWSAVAAGTVAACVLAAVVITGIEAATGSKLSGGDGRTFTSLVDVGDTEPEESPGDEPSKQRDHGTPPDQRQVTTPSPTPSPTEPGTEPSPAPTEAPEPVTEPDEPPAEDGPPGDEPPDPGDGDGDTGAGGS